MIVSSSALAALLLLFALPAAAQQAPRCVLDAARSGLPAFLDQIPPGSEADYGFGSGEEVRQATLGEPYRLHVVEPRAVLDFVPGTPVSKLISATSLWYFPVEVAGRATAFLVVEHEGSRCEAVSLGQAELARRVAEVASARFQPAGRRPRLVVVYQAKEFFLADPEGRPANLFALERRAGAPLAAPGDASGDDDLERTMRRLRPVVEQELKEGTP